MSDSPEQDRGGHRGDPDLAGYLHKESPRRGEPDALTTLPTPDDPPPQPGGDPYEGDMRDMEKSLVERIADVDDDRRRSAVQLRKALETHRDEISAQRRRDHSAMLLLAGVGIILLAAMVLLFAELIRTRDAMDARIAAVEQRGQQPAGPDTTAADIEAEMDQLGDAIEAIGDRLTALEGVSAQRTADLAASGSATRSAAATGSAPQIAQVQGEAPDARLAAMLDERLAALEARIDELRAARPVQSDAEAAAIEAAGSSQPKAETALTTSRTLTTDKDMVVLQLAGLPNRADVEYFIARHQLPKQIYVKVDSLRGRTWYGVIAGLYPDMAAAEAARDALPPELAKLDIWLRILPAGTQLEVLKGKG